MILSVKYTLYGNTRFVFVFKVIIPFVYTNIFIGLQLLKFVIANRHFCDPDLWRHVLTLNPWGFHRIVRFRPVTTEKYSARGADVFEFGSLERQQCWANGRVCTCPPVHVCVVNIGFPKPKLFYALGAVIIMIQNLRVFKWEKGKFLGFPQLVK